MTLQLDHFIVPARDKVAAAKHLAALLGVRWSEPAGGPFAPVFLNEGLTLDFMDDTAFGSHPMTSMRSLAASEKPGFRTAAKCADPPTEGSTHDSVARTSTGTSPTVTSGKS
jgi:hypothetical protein